VPLTHFVLRAKKFLACGPKFYVEFSVPPEFSGGVTEKYLSTVWATFRLGSRYSTIAPLPPCVYNAMTCIVFLLGIFRAVSVVTRSRIFRPHLVVTCRDFPAVSAVMAAEFSGRIR
jgi:hypothetical protein